MKSKRIVITGGPSTGKSSLVHKLEEKGYSCLHEVSREIISAAQKDGIQQLFLEDPILFSQKVLEAREIQFNSVMNSEEKVIFLDRGIPDILAYMDYLCTKYPYQFIESCKNFQYDRIFLLPPWKEIHVTDLERYESFEQAVAIHKALENTYRFYGYNIFEVPKTSVESRAQFILDNLID